MAKFFEHLLALAMCIMYVGADSDAIRLVSMEDNGFNSQNGIVQVMQKFSWSFINGSDWNLPNAIVACRNLGFRGLASYYTVSINMTDYSDAQLITNTLQCNGTEKYLRKCNTSGQTDVVRLSSASPANVAAVSCSGFASVQLIGGNGAHEGWVKILYNDTWGSVCDDYWGENDTHVVCKHLGYPGRAGSVLSSVAASSLMRPSLDEDKSKIWIDDSNCTMEDFDIRLCRKKDWGSIKGCDSSEDVAVHCEVPQICPVLPVVSLAKTIPMVVNGFFEPGEAVDFYCRNSTQYTRRAITIACQSDGVWSENPPFCIPSFSGKKCALPPEMLNGVYMRNISSTVQFTCNHGYNLLGPKEIHCVDEMWNDIPPTCLPSRGGSEKCFLPERVWHSKVVMSIDTSSVSAYKSVGFTCKDKSEVLVGYSQITCIKRGTWSDWNGPIPMCIQASSKVRGSVGSFSPPSSITGNVSTICGVVIGALVIALFTGMVVIIGIIAINISRRKRSTSLDNQLLNNLSSPLVNSGSDGEEM